MKTSVSQLGNVFFVVLLAFFVIVSCDSPDLYDSSVSLESTKGRLSEKETALTISKKPYEDQLNYRRENLKILGEAMIKMAQNQEFRKLVYSEIDKHFDGDDDVLIETLFASNLINNDKDSGGLKTYAKNLGVQNSLHAFKNIEKERSTEKESYFPHLYIPYYSKFKADRNLLKPLVVVPWDGNESTDQAYGYTIKDGIFKKLEIVVDKSFCENNEVWVISLNERVDNYGKIKNGVQSHKQGRETANPQNTNETIDGKISYMTLYCQYESVYGGQNDMYINGGSTFMNGIDPDTGGEKNWRVAEAERCQIANISGNYLNENIYVNYVCYRNWDPFRPEPGPRGTHFFYTIYEADNWPARLRDISTSVGSKVFTLEYRSSDDAPDAHNVSLQTLSNDGLTRTRPCIKYSMGRFYVN